MVALAGVLALAACSDTQEPGRDTTAATGAPATTTTVAAPATSTSAADRELTDRSRVRLDGIGPVRMGMTLAEAAAAIGRRVSVDPDSLIGGEEEDLCGFAGVAGGPAGLSFMVNRDGPGAEWRIVRLDVVDGDIATGGGVRIGSTEDEVKRVYGDRLAVEPHEYRGAQGAHYLVLDVDGPDGFLLLFETDGTRVLQYRSGLEGAVRAPEGCA